MKKRVADIIMDSLVELGVTDCFSVVGGGAMYLDNALLHCKAMNKIFNHHEQACAMAAEGYAKMGGNIPLVCVTSGPGATNTLTGVMGAWVDSIPMFIISGQMRYNTTVKQSGLPLRSRGSQEFNIVDTVKTMTKYSKMILNPIEIRAEVVKAYHIAMSGRRGPVWLDIPIDVQMAVIDTEQLVDNYFNDYQEPQVSDNDIAFLLAKIKDAKRPVVIAGNAIQNCGYIDGFKRFADKLKVPVVASTCSGDVLGWDNPLFYGICGTFGTRTGNFVIQNSDLVLAIGTSLGFETTGYNQDGFAPGAFKIMVDTDVFEVQKPGLRIDYFIHSDLNYFFEKISNTDYVSNIDFKWKEYCERVKKKFTPFESAKKINMQGRVNSYYFWQEFEKIETDDYIVALGNNTGITAKIQVGKKKDSQRILANGHCGSMGYDLPAAEGAAVASGRTVYCATGDGSIMMNLQELQTIRHYNLPIKIILFANNGYNKIRQTSKNYFNGEEIGCSPDTGVSFPDFDKVARTFEFPCIECKNNSEVIESIKWIKGKKDMAMLIVDEIIDEPIVPKLMSRVDENGDFQTPVLQDMYPFLPEDKVNEFMDISR